MLAKLRRKTRKQTFTTLRLRSGRRASLEEKSDLRRYGTVKRVLIKLLKSGLSEGGNSDLRGQILENEGRRPFAVMAISRERAKPTEALPPPLLKGPGWVASRGAISPLHMKQGEGLKTSSKVNARALKNGFSRNIERDSMGWL